MSEPFVFCTRDGNLYRGSAFVASGYSGHEQGRNAPEFENVHNVGPIPRGEWTIQGPPQTSPTHGPYVLHLQPARTTQTFGRSGFLIHGDRVGGAAGMASEGCIILPRNIREAIWDSGERQLLVVSEPPVDDDATPAVS